MREINQDYMSDFFNEIETTVEKAFSVSLGVTAIAIGIAVMFHAKR